MTYCNQPFNRIEIYENGDVYNCCPALVSYHLIGNIFKTPFSEIWNGEKIQYLRKTILDGDYSLCSNLCPQKKQGKHQRNAETIVNDYPEEISISTDNACNVRCKICRDEFYHTEYNAKKLDKEIDEIWLPILKNAKSLRFGCSGEPFASYKEKLLIKRAAAKYPNIKFHIHTNGILTNEKMLKELNIYDKLDTITVSLHSASRWTYNKIVRGGNYGKVMKNLKLYSQMKKEGTLKNFRLVFVVYDENYKDMIDFVKLAKKNNAVACFWGLREVERTKINNNFKKHSIVNSENKHNKNLIKILKNSIFDSDNVELYPELKELRGIN